MNMAAPNFVRISVDIPHSLKEALDRASLSQTQIRNCRECNSNAWHPTGEVDGATGVGAYACAACGAACKVLRTVKIIRSSSDGSSPVDQAIATFFDAPRHRDGVARIVKRWRKANPHVNLERIGLYMGRGLHRRVKMAAYDARIPLSALLAEIIGERFSPTPAKAA